jgi:hypothetical protein
MHNKRAERVFSLMLITVCLFFYYGKFILSPNTYLSGLSGDGIMINYTYAGHIKNDSTYTNFQGMNYPYGQTQIYTGGHPIFSNAVKFLSQFSPWFVSHSIGIINILIVLSYIGCAFFLCLILQKLRLPSELVIFGSVGITLLSPQIFRWSGHPEISYAVFFPLTWWLFIQFLESEKTWRWSLLIICNSIFWFFVCPYFIMLGSVFYAACYFVIALQKKQKSVTKKKILAALAQLILPLLISRLYLLAVDVHEFRSEHPYGFNVYFAKLNTVFAPFSPPFESIFQKVFKMQDRHWEGWAYIGFPSVVIAVYSIFRILRYIIKKRFSSVINPGVPPTLRSAVWASILVLIFSMCMPFRLAPNLFFGHLGFIEQFRSLGRFAWIFYYVFTVYSLYISYLFFRRTKIKQKRLFGYAWCMFFIACLYVESYSYHKNNAESIYASKNYFNAKLIPQEVTEVIDKINDIKQNYQCLIPLPFYHVGTENFGKDFSDELITKSMTIAYWTNFPLLSNSTARSPILEAKKIMQFFSPPLTKKAIQNDLPDKNPFLIIYDKEKLSKDEKYWLEESIKIFENKAFVLSELPYEKVFADNFNEEIENFDRIRASLVNYHGLFVSSLPDTLVYLNFDVFKNKPVFRGSGSFKGIKKAFTDIIPKTDCFLKKDKDYVVGFWYYNKGELRNQISCILEEAEDNNANQSWSILIDPKCTMKIDGDWSYVEKKFRIKSDTKKIRLFLKGDDYSKQEFFLDDFILRPANTDVYFTNQTTTDNEKEELRKSFFMRTENSEKLEKEARFTEIINTIYHTNNWLKLEIEKAGARHLPLDSMVKIDAQFMLKNEK